MKAKLCVLLAAFLGIFSPTLLAGNLKVNLTPTQAVSAGAQWRVDGGSWRNSGSTASGLSNGTHQVSFSTVSGWIAPAATNVTVTSGTTTLSYAYVQASSLKITLTPSTGKWRVDGGAWQNSAATVANLAPGTHTVDYQALSGYAAPSSESVTLTSGQLASLSRSYTQLSSLKITLTPSTGKWRVDGGTWQNSAATVANLAPGAHSVDYQPLAGYAAPNSESVTLTSGQLTSLNRSFTQLASLTLSLTPASAQWRVDGGAWQNSGATVANLSVGSHSIDYAPASGYLTLNSESVSLSAGQALSLNRAYVALPRLTVNLTPGSAQWQVDGGAWRASGSTATGLSVGSHTVAYSNVAGYVTPTSESVTLAAGEAPTLSRSYIQLAQLTITLSNPSGQFRVDGGAWQPSGATVANLTAGAHSVSYSAVSGYASPADESVTLAAGQSLSLARHYTQLAAVTITLIPASGQWRIDGGAWQAGGATLYVAPGSHAIDYAAVEWFDPPAGEAISLAEGGTFTVTRNYVSQKPTLRFDLSPGSGQWRVDGGAWQPSNATVAELSIGNHSVEFADIGGIYDPPASETVALALRENAVLARTYPFKKATVTVSLDPSWTRWRIDSGDWRNSGTTALDLPAGSHTLEYEAANNYITPVSETVSLTYGQNLSVTRTYVPLASLQFLLNPTWTGAKWRIDGGPWINSGDRVDNLSFGTPHLIEFSAVDGYLAPAPQSITLASGEYRGSAVNYQQLASIVSYSDPTWLSAQFRVDGGPWTNTGQAVTNLAFGVSHTIEFSSVDGYVAPPPQTVTLSSGQYYTAFGAYQQLASIVSYPDPSWLSAQFRVDGGAWTNSGQAVTHLAFGVPHTIEFSNVDGFVAPQAQTVTLSPGQYHTAFGVYQQLASIVAYPNPSWVSSQFRVDGGAWTNPGQAVVNLAFGVPHTIEFSSADGFVTPPPQTVTLSPGQYHTAFGTYQQLASIVGYVNPSWVSAQYRVDGGNWTNSGLAITHLAFGVPHTIEFSPVEGFITPTLQTVTLEPGQYFTAFGAYQQFASLTVTLNLTAAQWRIDGGAWNANGATVSDLTSGDHVLEYSAVADYVAPQTETITLSGGPMTLGRSYSPLPPFTIVHAFDDAGNLPTAIRGSDGWVYVATNCGITNGLGLLYKMQPDGSQRQLVLRFGTSVVPGMQPKALLEGSDGVLYGTTLYGSGSTATVSNATIYRINRDGSGYATLYTFNVANWGRPNALIEGSDGALYGTTTSATGSSSARNGTIFRLNKDGSGFTVLRYLASSEGINPQGICQFPGGQLYITTKTGGANNLGTIFTMTLAGVSPAVTKHFAGGADGSDPRARLTAGSDGFLYGTTAAGGSAGRGLVFRINPDSTGYQVLHHFLGSTTDGSLPEGALVEQPDGMLYGTTSTGGTNNRGTVFRLNKDGSSYATTKSITGAPEEGYAPRFDLVPLGNGRLLGATIMLGAATKGVFFTLNLDGSGFTTILQQGAVEGAEPWSIVTEADGVLYGSAHAGGVGNNGTLYRVNRDGTGFAVIKSFTTTEGAAYPLAPLLAASDGLLYGSTYSPSKIFRVERDGSNYTVIQDFSNSANGGTAWGGMVEASDGFVYGTTMGGGATGYGVIYRFAKPGTGYTILRSFTNSTTDGGQPGGALREGLDGRLYGTTTTGGSANLGTVFALNKDGTGFTVLHHFTGGADGNGPYAGVLQRADGTLYGTTNAGGSANLGTLYKLAPDGSGYAVLKSFTGGTADGTQPTLCAMIEHNGKLYGTAVQGGLDDAGIIYRINPDGSGFEILVNFGQGTNDTSYPWVGLTNGSDGKLYGTTTRGPSSGAIYRLNPD